jgi:glyoxylase-like metal-dependent hydrolase (beta-lactamase superfamily II)
MTVYLGNRRVDVFCPGRAHTAGDAVVWVPDAEVMFTGDIVEYHSACYCGDGHLQDWSGTLDVIADVGPQAIAPGRGDALIGPKWSPPPSRARGISWPRPMRPPPGSRRGAAA